MIKLAKISSCGLYRPLLLRRWNLDKPLCSFGGVNPSTADASIDDATVRKWIGFATRLGFGGFVAWNNFDYRSTDVRMLGKVSKPISKENDLAITMALQSCEMNFAGWGSETKVPSRLRHRFREVEGLAMSLGTPLHCIGKTKAGNPRHALMTAYSTPVELYMEPDT